MVSTLKVVSHEFLFTIRYRVASFEDLRYVGVWTSLRRLILDAFNDFVNIRMVKYMVTISRLPLAASSASL